MSRFAVCTILAVAFISCVYSQVAGGYNAVPADKHGELIEQINSVKHTGEIADGKLIKINCATSQVVAGANYIVNGVWKVGDDEKNCQIKYSRDLDGHIKVNDVKCGIKSCVNAEELATLVG